MAGLICNVRKIPHHLRVGMLADLHHRRRIADDHLEMLLLDAMAADPEPYPGDTIACEKQYVRDEVAAIQRVAPVTAGKRVHIAAQREPDHTTAWIPRLQPPRRPLRQRPRRPGD